jgi:hypothetical protein
MTGLSWRRPLRRTSRQKPTLPHRFEEEKAERTKNEKSKLRKRIQTKKTKKLGDTAKPVRKGKGGI